MKAMEMKENQRTLITIKEKTEEHLKQCFFREYLNVCENELKTNKENLRKSIKNVGISANQ